MTLRSKTLKPLRFLRSTLAFGLLAACFASEASSSPTAGKDKCVSEFESKLKKIEKVEISKIEPEKICLASEGTENDKAPEVAKRTKLKLSKGEVKTTFEGACQSTFEAVKDVYENLVQSRTKVCEEMHAEINNKFPNCLSENPADTCKKNLTSMVDIYKTGREKLKSDISEARKFLKTHADWNKSAKKKFEDDFKELKALRARDIEKLNESITPDDSPHRVEAQKQASANLKEYLQKFEVSSGNITLAKLVGKNGAPAQASPIQEQELAQTLAEKFRKKLEDFNSSEESNFTASLSEFREKINKPDETGTIGEKFSKYGPAAAPLANTFLNTGNNTPAPVSSIGGGSSGALPALALAGAAGLALGAGKKSSAGSSLVPDGPVMTPNNSAEAATFDGVVKNASAGDTAAVAATPTKDADEESESEAAPSAPVLNSHNGYGGGASSFPGAMNAKKETSRAPATPSTAGTDETLTPFAGDLRPKPRPTAPADTAGNEVTALLNKMQGLFNLDENFGMDMPPPDFMGSGGPVTPANYGAPVNGGAEGDYASDYTDEEYAGDSYAEGEEQMQASNPMGSTDVTLFRRVRARHFKCMEKGLVLLMQQELPE